MSNPSSVVALLFGLSYKDNESLESLKGPKNNVEKLEKALLQLGVDPISYIENDESIYSYTTMIEKLEAFQKETADTKIFYFAGHGIQEDDLYLIPSDSKNFRPKTSIPLSDIAEEYLKNCKNKIIIIDACRSGEDQKKNLKLEYDNTLIALSTSFGKIALDSTKDNDCTIYTKLLIEEIQKEGLEIVQIFQNIGKKVVSFYKSKQHSTDDPIQDPTYLSKLTSDFYFKIGENKRRKEETDKTEILTSFDFKEQWNNFKNFIKPKSTEKIGIFSIKGESNDRKLMQLCFYYRWSQDPAYQNIEIHNELVLDFDKINSFNQFVQKGLAGFLGISNSFTIEDAKNKFAQKLKQQPCIVRFDNLNKFDEIDTLLDFFQNLENDIQNSKDSSNKLVIISFIEDNKNYFVKQLSDLTNHIDIESIKCWDDNRIHKLRLLSGTEYDFDDELEIQQFLEIELEIKSIKNCTVFRFIHSLDDAYNEGKFFAKCL